MKIKLNLKNIVIGISAAIVLFLIIFFIILGIHNKKPVAAFYGISEKNVEDITTVLNTTHQRKNKKSAAFETLVLDENKSLEYALKGQKKPDILFIYTGDNAAYAEKIAAKRKTGFDTSILEGMTTSIKSIAPVTGDKVTGVPLLIDNYEVDVNLAQFNSSGIENINVWNDIQSLALKTKTSTLAPVIFPAANDYEFLNFMGAMLESVSGREAYDKVVEKVHSNIRSGKLSTQSFFNLASEMFSPDGEFYETGKLLKEWMTIGILPKNILQINERDIKAFMSSDNLTSIAFMTLSQHRTFERSVISKYSSIYYPSTEINVDRSFTAPVILAVPLSKDKVSRNGIRMLAYSLQSTLSAKTGLAPTQAQAGVPDKQADDARYWVAASNPPVPGLAQAFTTKNTRAAFAEALRSQLR